MAARACAISSESQVAEILELRMTDD
jgi:hypothetical protein